MNSSVQTPHWSPHVTVAALIEQDGQYLMVEEYDHDQLVINQPAGHWEPCESLAQAVVRETLEETGYDVVPNALVGIYNWLHPASQQTFLRFAFSCTCIKQVTTETDPDIHRARWFDLATIRSDSCQKRSPLVLKTIEDALAGCHYPLSILNNL